MNPLPPKGQGYFDPSRETLAMSTEQRNLAPMMRTSAPIGNEASLSSGLVDKVGANSQPYVNEVHTMQGKKQNIITAIPQAAANASRGANKQATDEAQAAHQAQDLRFRYTAALADQMQGGGALMAMSTLDRDPAAAKLFMNRIAEGQLQAQANNPQTKFQSTNFYG